MASFGRARGVRYYAPRRIADLGWRVSVYEVLADGTVAPYAELAGAEPQGYVLEGQREGLPSAYYADLPWLVNDLRPAGFLGRLAARQHPAPGLPVSLGEWRGDHILEHLARHGANLVGGLIVGEAALDLAVRARAAPRDRVSAGEREVLYPRLAADVLSYGDPGSSAAGEQPKFLVSRAEDGQGLLVKFSPPLADSDVARRVADLLLAEHLALATLAEGGVPASRSRYLELGGRAFLEVERFDRLAPFGRRHLVTLGTLDAEYGEDGLGGWTHVTRGLARQRVVPAALVDPVALLDRFGALIGNTDRHAGNLSFFVDGAAVVDLCPAYDMTPMRYAPRHHELAPEAPWVVPVHPVVAPPIEARARALARAFWGAVLAEARSSAWLCAVAQQHLAAEASADGRAASSV